MTHTDTSAKTQSGSKLCRDLKLSLPHSPVLRAITLKYEERTGKPGTPCTIYLNGHPAATRKFWDFAEAAKDEMNRLPDDFQYLSSEVKFGFFGQVHAPNGTHHLAPRASHHVFHPGHGPDPAVGINSFGAEHFYTATRKFLRLAVKQGVLSKDDYDQAVPVLRAFFKEIHDIKHPPGDLNPAS